MTTSMAFEKLKTEVQAQANHRLFQRKKRKLQNFQRISISVAALLNLNVYNTKHAKENGKIIWKIVRNFEQKRNDFLKDLIYGIHNTKKCM